MKPFLDALMPGDGRAAAGWDGARLFAAWAARASGRKILKTASFPLESEADGPALRRRLAEAGLVRARVTAVLPQRLLVARPCRLPSTDRRELVEMASLQACRQLPFPPEEILSDLDVLEVEPGGFSRGLLLVARREDVASHLSVLRSAGLVPERMVSGVHGAAPLFRADGGGRGAVLVLEAGPGGASAFVLSEGKVVHARGLPWEPGDSAAAADRLVKELRMTWDAFLRERGPASAARLRVAAMPGVPGGLAEAAARETGLPLEPFDPWKELPFRLDGEPVPFSVLGAALLPPETPLDLMPPEERRRGEERRRRRDFSRLALWLSAALLLAGALWARREAVLRQRLEGLRARRAAVGVEARRLSDMERALEGLRLQRGDPGSLVNVLGRVNAALPPGVVLSAVEFERDRFAVLEGRTFTLAEAVGLVNVLEKQGLFKKVSLRSTSAERLHGKDVVGFEIVGRLSDRPSSPELP